MPLNPHGKGLGVAKNKRKASAAQRDKTNILIAKKLKEAGIISKQAKLHSGRYISKEVLRKVREYEASARLGYRAVPVTKEIAKAAKERGFQVVAGNKIIGPNSPTFRNRLKSGIITGVRPVKGGMMEEVILPHSIMDMAGLVEQLENGIDTLKLPEEQFAFRFYGNESYRAFMDTKDLLQYLRTYKGIFDLTGSVKPEDLQEQFQNFTIFRLHPAAIELNIRGTRQRRIDRQKERMEKIKRGEYVTRRTGKTRAEKLAAMHPNRAAKYLEKSAARDRARREKLAADPAALAEYRAKAKARAKKSRDTKKAK